MERWTKQEDRVLCRQVARYPHNLTTAFTETARIVGRSKDACRLRWYCYKADDPETNVCFATISRRGSTINRKRKLAQKKPKGWWGKIKKFLKI